MPLSSVIRVAAAGFLLAAGLAAQSASEPSRVGVGLVQRKLTLGEAIEMAIANNLDVAIERTNTAAAERGIQAAKGAFDPILTFRPSIDSRTTPTSSMLQGPGGSLTDHAFNNRLGLQQKLPWTGTLLSFNLNTNRQSTSSPFVSLNPYVTSGLGVTFTQPLLRNSTIDRDRAELQIRRKQNDLSITGLRMRLIDIVTQVQGGYWSLVAARQDVRVKADAERLASEQRDRSERMIKSGVLAEVELAAADAELERRRDTYFASVAGLTEAENALKMLLAPNRGAELWGDQILPAEERTAEPAPIYDLGESITTAMALRPELQSVDLQKDINAVEKRLNASYTKPGLDLVASYGTSGLGGTSLTQSNPFTSSTAVLTERVNALSTAAGLTPLPVASAGGMPPFLVGGYDTSLSNLFSTRYQTFQVGINFDLNLRNRTAGAALAQSAIAEKRLGLQRDQMEQAIQVQVRNAIQAIETSRQRVRAAEASVRAAKEKLDSETRLFENGETTNFLVLTRQNEYLDSQLRLIVGRLDLNRAVARYEQAVGSTLQSRNIAVK
ncbi:MAG TPA: TolC family protein [Bryobacteraceae bacterium]|nr:TolC family protein [Bryobacteraceae bacterium]